MFVKNSFEYDARVDKEAVSLTEAGHEVTVVAIHVPGVTAERETTPEGVNVVRVSRLSFGMGTIQKVQRGMVTGIEERRSRLTGEEVQAERIDRYGRLLKASTATPGDDSARRYVPPERVEAPEPSRLRRRWGAITTPILRIGYQFVRLMYRIVRPLFIWQTRGLRTWTINRRFIRAGLETGADVWHSHDLNTLYIGWKCKKKRPGTKLVYDSHELQTERNRMGKVARWWATWNEKRGLPHTDARIWTTDSRARYVVEKYGIPYPTILRNVPEIIEIEEGWDLRERLDIPADQRVLVYQGSIQENRGIEEAIEAVASHLEDCVLVVIGYGHHRPVLEEMVTERGLDDRVKFFGPIPNDELLFYTASADVGLCTIKGNSLSYRWSLPNKLFEYMMAGIPIVASDYEEMGRVVREEGVGTVCDPGDPESVAAAVRGIVEDPEAEKRFRAATRTAIQKYNWGVEEQVLLGLYEGLVGANGE